MKTPVMVKIKKWDTEMTVAAREVKDGLGIIPYYRKDSSKSPDYYEIVHLESGLRLPFSISFKLRQAQRVLEWLLSMMNWNRPEIEVTTDWQTSCKAAYIALNRLEVSNWGRP